MSLSRGEQRERMIRRAAFQGYVWCPFGYWFDRDSEEPHVHHIVKKRHWVEPEFAHVLLNLVAICAQHHLPRVFPWHDERPHFRMRVFATLTGGEYSLLSRHRDQYMSWPRVRLAVLERDRHQCQCCRARRRYIDKRLYDDGFTGFIRYRGSNVRPYHFANPNERPMIAHLTDEMTTLCFCCYWKNGGEEAPRGWRKQPYQKWKPRFSEV